MLVASDNRPALLLWLMLVLTVPLLVLILCVRTGLRFVGDGGVMYELVDRCFSDMTVDERDGRW